MRNAEFLKGLNAEGAVRKILRNWGLNAECGKVVFINFFFNFFSLYANF